MSMDIQEPPKSDGWVREFPIHIYIQGSSLELRTWVVQVFGRYVADCPGIVGWYLTCKDCKIRYGEG